MTSFTLSAFGDEIDQDLETQINTLVSLDIHHIEFRGAWGRNVLELERSELARAKALLAQRGMRVSAIGSPLGKSALGEPPAFEMGRLEQAIAAAEILGTPLIRIFSFYTATSEAAQRRDEVLARMAGMVELAEHAGITLLHENEKGIYGDTAARCRDMLASIASPALRAAFDPANFVQVGERPMVDGWPLLEEYVTHVHIKDALFADGSVCPAGEGDGDVPGLLAALVARGYSGFLTLEPHLQIAGPSGGYSGDIGMRTAAAALRGLLTALPSDVRIL